MTDDQNTGNTLPPGTRIGSDFEIVALIKAGGMGEVYRGRNVHLDTPVAIKVVLPELSSDDLVRNAFLKEATVLSNLYHEYIVRYMTFTFDATLDRYCLVMEFVSGVQLGDYVKGKGLPGDQARDLLRKLALGLRAAHGVGVIHRDMSLDNVILSGGDVSKPKIIDFGIAKETDPGSVTVFESATVGKYGYMAPEQLGAYDKRVGSHTDVYSLGLVMVGACRGKPVDMGSNPHEAFVARQQVPDLDGVPPDMIPVLARMLQPDPAYRAADMDEVIALLEAPEETADDGEKTMIGVPVLEKGDLDDLLPPRPAAAEKTLPPVPEPQSNGGGGGKGVLVGVLLGLAILGGGGYVAFTQGMLPGVGGDEIAEAPPVTDPPPVPDPPEDLSEDPVEEIETVEIADPPAVDPPQAPPDETVPRGEVVAGLPEPVVDVPDVVGDPPDPPDAPDPPDEIAEPDPPADDPVISDTELDNLNALMTWLDNYGTGPCSHVSVTSMTDRSVNLEAYGTDPEPFAKMVDDFERIQGITPSVIFQQITDFQCSVLDFVAWNREGDQSRTILDVRDDTLAPASELNGTLQGPIGEHIFLGIVAPDGRLTDVSTAANIESDNRALFTVDLGGMTITPGAHLLVSLTSPESLDFVRTLVGRGNADQVLGSIRTLLLLDERPVSVATRYFVVR